MRKRPPSCRRCGRPDSEAGRISWGGLCIDCGTDATLDQARQMNAKSGPLYEKWKAAMERDARRRFGVPQRPGL